MNTNTGFQKILMAFGGLFLILLLIGVGFFIANSFNGTGGTRYGGFQMPGMNQSSQATQDDANPMLSSEQEAALRAMGIDPAGLPSSITPEMEACFTAKLGAARVAEIKAGASPSAMEFFKAKECI